MKVDVRTCWTVLLLTLVTSVIPMQELAAADSVGDVEQLVRSFNQPAINDVELAAGGVLAGQIVDAAGLPLAGEPIVVRQADRVPIRTSSDENGSFRLSGLNAGLCRIQYGETLVACRCWSPNTAPPVATNELLLITGEPIQRAQRCLADLISGPCLIGLIIAAAVVIPIAVHNSQKDAS